jgi:hypothetical protein
MNNTKLKAIQKQTEVIQFWTDANRRANNRLTDTQRMGFIDPQTGRSFFVESEAEHQEREKKANDLTKFCSIRLQHSIEKLTSLT